MDKTVVCINPIDYNNSVWGYKCEWGALSVSGLVVGVSEPVYGCRHVNTVSRSRMSDVWIVSIYIQI